MLAMLAVAGPLFARGAEPALAPVVDLNPRFSAAVSEQPKEPKQLVIVSEALPLLSDAPVAKTPKASNRRAKPTPAVRSAVPFDPVAKKQTGSGDNSQRSETRWDARIAPIIHVYAPITKPRPALVLKPRLAANDSAPTGGRTTTKIRTFDRSVFLATRSDRLERTIVPKTRIASMPNQLSTRLASVLNSLPQNPLLVANEQPQIIAQPKLSGFIATATQVPVSSARKSAKRELDKPATHPVRHAAPRVVLAVESPVELAEKEAGDLAKVIFPAENKADSRSQRDRLPEQDDLVDVAKEFETPKESVVIAKHNPIALGFAADFVSTQPQAKTSQPRNVRKEIKPSLPEIANTELQVVPPAVTTNPIIQFAESVPLLTTLQQAPSPSDLPVPDEVLAEEQNDDAEVIAAFDLDFKPMSDLSAQTKPEEGELPKDYAAARFAREGEITHRMGFSRTTTEISMMWEAPASSHRPLYFEDINLERHGYKVPLIQPALSAAHFFGRVPMLPYMMVSEGYCKPQYTLGHYRPGDYAPYSLHVPRFRLDASAAELAMAAGILFAFP